ncbi:MAG: acetylglutamate kinase [Salinivirgaceae bacterium]
MREKLTIIKAGGKVLDTESDLQQLLNRVASVKGKKLLVHGGGIFIEQLCQKLQIPTQMLNGRRITSPETMDVALMVCAGKLNKQLVSGLNKLGNAAVGLCGGDFNLMISQKRSPVPVDYGMVGDITRINTEWLHWLLQKEVIPVVSSITQSSDFELLNTNADTVASHLAIAMQATYDVELYFYFDKPGVLANADNPDSGIAQLSDTLMKQMRQQKSIHSGMLPKLENGFYALQQGVSSVVLGNGCGSGTRLFLEKY